jgi:hypothetical protein
MATSHGSRDLRKCLAPFWTRVVDLCRNLLVTHQNSYSIERLLSVDAYSASSPLVHVGIVCLVTPMPALAISILLELIPLKSPDGLDDAHHRAIWVRFSLSSFISSFFILTIAKSKVPELELPRWERGCIAAAVSAIYNIVNYGLAQRVFAVPFQLVLGIFPSGMLAIVMARVAIGSTPFTTTYGLRPQLLWLFKMLLTKTALMIVYPAYTTLFLSVPPTAQKLLVPGLPLMKLVLKKIVARSAHHLTDFLPVTVILLVDVFNSLYMAVCMHSTGSMTTALILMGIDILEAMWSLRRINAGASPTLALLGQIRVHDAESGSPILSTQARFMRAVARLAEQPEHLNQSRLRSVCLNACLPHPLASEDKAMVKKLFSREIYRDGRKARFALVDHGLAYQVGTIMKRLSSRNSTANGLPSPPMRRSGVVVIDAALVQKELVEPTQASYPTAHASSSGPTRKLG